MLGETANGIKTVLKTGLATIYTNNQFMAVNMVKIIFYILMTCW